MFATRNSFLKQKMLFGHLQTNGYNVAKEVHAGAGKTIDLVAAQKTAKIAFEIETGKSDAAANVKEVS